MVQSACASRRESVDGFVVRNSWCLDCFTHHALRTRFIWLAATALILLAGCSTAGSQPLAEATITAEQDTLHSAEDEMLTLPTLAASVLKGERLRVVATTSIIGDVVANVGGDKIALTTLMAPGQDPHSYEPVARDLTAVSQADVILVNGWGLEENLVSSLETIGGDVPLVAVSANIAPLPLGAGEEGLDHGSVDPHVWFDINNVAQWAENIAQIFSDLNPDNASIYTDNAANYLAELETLATSVEAQIAQLPVEKRFLVTNHDSFGYLADAYDFEILGAVIPSVSTLSEPSAADLTDLVAAMRAHDLCTIFAESTQSDRLAQTVASELANCDSIQVLPLYSGSLGPVGSGAASYTEMFAQNIQTIVDGLR